MQKCARIQVLLVCFRFFVPTMDLNNLDHFCRLSRWIFQALSNTLTRCNNDFWGVAWGCLFIHKIGHVFFAISTLDPQSNGQIDFCAAASIWFKGSREHRISSLPGSSVYNPGFVDFVQQTWQPFTLEQRPCCIVLEFPVISKQHACCTLWFSMCIDLQTTNAIIYLGDTTPYLWNQQYAWFYLYVVTALN